MCVDVCVCVCADVCLVCVCVCVCVCVMNPCKQYIESHTVRLNPGFTTSSLLGNGDCFCDSCSCNQGYTGYSCGCPTSQLQCVEPGAKVWAWLSKLVGEWSLFMLSYPPPSSECVFECRSVSLWHLHMQQCHSSHRNLLRGVQGTLC